MTTNRPEELISVYSTPLEYEAEMVKAMLADEEISSTVENANGPFPGLGAAPCEVLVAAENEAAARRLIEEHEARHRDRVAHEAEEEDEDAAE